MANKRMFSKDIVAGSCFIMLPSSARDLYFYLCLYADDDGYCEYVAVMRLIAGDNKDLRVLQENSLVCVYNLYTLCIQDWYTHNKIPPSRYSESKYLKVFENRELPIEEQYNPIVSGCIQAVHKVYVESSIDKGSIEEKRRDKDTLARQAISLFNDIAKTKHDINNPTHLKRCNIIIKAYKGNGTRDDAGILSKFEYVFTNQKKSADDPASGWDDKFYRLSTLTRKTNFFDYVDREPYNPEVKETSQQRRIRLLEEHTSDTK